MLSNNDPNSEPSGTPDNTTEGNESMPNICKQYCLFVKELLSQFKYPGGRRRLFGPF
jgi:hypothetical protein